MDPSRVLIPAGVLKGLVAALMLIGGIVGGIYWRLGSHEVLQREQAVKLDMMLDLWRQTAQDIKERPTRHEFEDLRQEFRAKRGE